MANNVDTLYLLKPGFEDEQFPGKRFYCPHCALMEGVLASFPEAGKDLVVKRLPFPRPRPEIVSKIGDVYQSLPLIILASDAQKFDFTLEANGYQFAQKNYDILKLLSLRHGFPERHP